MSVYLDSLFLAALFSVCTTNERLYLKRLRTVEQQNVGTNKKRLNLSSISDKSEPLNHIN
jgi:hypothetical protein